MAASRSPSRSDRATRVAAVGAVAVSICVHVWIVSAGRMTSWPTYTSYYSMLSSAFLHGQASLLVRPAPELLALPDPYDPDQNRGLRIHDLSLYHGNYYLYWGPVPALLMAPLRRFSSQAIGDQYVVFAFVAALLAVSARLLMAIRSRFFPGAPAWTLALGILVAGLATPVPFVLARAAIYEAAIVAGQFFLIAGLYLSFTAFSAGLNVRVRLAGAGACWAMAMGSRPSLAIAIFALVCLTAREIFTSRQRTNRKTLPDLAFLLAPLLLGGLLLGGYNAARFDSWHEFGQRYQLAGVNLRLVQDHLFARQNVPMAAYAYFFKPLGSVWKFPFIKAVGGIMTYPWFLNPPADYEAFEPVAGILWCTPFVLLGVAAFEPLLRRRVSASAGKKSPVAGGPLGISAALLAASLLGVLPVVFLIGCTMRYLADFAPGLILLAVVGMWQSIHDRPQVRSRLLVQASVLAAYSIVVGILLGLTGYTGHFHANHPGYLGL